MTTSCMFRYVRFVFCAYALLQIGKLLMLLHLHAQFPGRLGANTSNYGVGKYTLFLSGF